ncbi:MAG: hypothetical protein O2894_07295 [Planctomycetota bacterium]|nr:hypothetical protein [Planctomycetota bacterium]
MVRSALLCILSLPVLASAPRADAADKKALDEYFKGKVIALEGKVITLRYDFRKKDQAEDFVDRVPFRIKPRKEQRIGWFDDKLEIIGNSGARHKAEWVDEVVVTATFIPDLEKDFGGFVSPVAETEDFALYSFVETFFHAYDKNAGGDNSIIKFGAQWKETDGEEFIGFRYGPKKPPKDPIAIGKSIEATFGLEKKKLIFRLPEYELKKADWGVKLKRCHVGFYAIKGRLLLDNIEISGQLASDWLDREGIELRTAKPIAAEGEGGIDSETAQLMETHATGEAKSTRQLLSLLKDESREPVVKALMDCLTHGPKKTAQYAIDLLYHKEPSVRDRGIEIIDAHLGTDYGFKAKGAEKARSAAIQKLQQAIQDDPSLLDGITERSGKTK